MDKAKQAVSGFLHRDGKHDTTVHENVNPAVTNEHVARTQLDTATKAVDREVHQDHYHTSVQPVKDKEVLPEQHTHQMAGVEERNFNHGDDSHIKDRLAREQAQFKNTREVGDVQHTQAANKDVVGEHIHHHVHENIQPVIQKETIQPSVVHTTIPVHEVHQNEAKHHTASALPAMSLDEFKRQGGSLNGREERRDEFAGEPRSVGGIVGGPGAHGTTSRTKTDTSRHGIHRSGSSSSSSSASSSPDRKRGLTGSSAHRDGGITGSNDRHSGLYTSSSHFDGGATSHNERSGLTGHKDHGLTDNRHSGLTTSSSHFDGGRPSESHHIGGDNTYNTRSQRDSGIGGVGGHDTKASTAGTTGAKPSLLDKLNPLKDTNGDGKKGVMD